MQLSARFARKTVTVVSFLLTVIAPVVGRTLFSLLSLAVPAGAGDLYVSEFNTSSIEKLDGSTGAALGTFGSGGGGGPFGLACASNGNLLMARQSGDNILEFDNETGAVARVFASGLDSVNSMAFAPNGNVFVSVFGPRSIVELDGRTGAFVRTFASALAGGPYQLAFGPNGNLFVALDETATGGSNGSVVELDASTGTAVNTFPTTGIPRGLIFGPDGSLYVSLIVTNTVARFDVSTGQLIETLSGGLSGPHGMRFSPEGALFVVSHSDGRIAEYDSVNGSFATVASGLSTPLDVLVGTESGPCAPPIYVSDSSSGSIVQFDGASGERRGTFGVTGPRPFGMACAPNGNLLVATQQANTLIELDNATGSSLGAFASGLSVPTAVVTGPNGNVFVAEAGANRVSELDGQSGAFLRSLGSGIIQPHGLAFGPDGSLFVAQNDPAIGVVEVDPSTGNMVETFAAAGYARGLVFNAQGRLLVALLSNQIVELDVETGQQTAVLSGGLAGPHGIALDAVGNPIVMSSSSRQIVRFDPALGVFQTFAATGLGEPLGLIVGSSSGPCSTEPPTADAGGPYNGAEGDLITLDGGASSDPEGLPLDFSWFLPAVCDPGETEQTVNCRSFNEGQEEAELTVTDSTGLSNVDLASVVFVDVPPTVNAGPDQTAPEGQAVYVSAKFIDPGTFDRHTAEVDWGDGSAPQAVQPIDPQGVASGAVLAGHIYGAPGLYEVTVVVEDMANGAGGVDTLIVNYGLAPNTFGSEPPLTSEQFQSDSAWLGASVDVDGTIAVAGAPFETDTLSQQGAAYVYEHDGAHWNLIQRLIPPDPVATDQFGGAVAVSGTTIVVGSRLREPPAGGNNAGGIFVFERNPSTSMWELAQELSASDAQGGDFLGTDVDIDGHYIVAGARGEDDGGAEAGAIYVFQRALAGWTEVQKLTVAEAGAGLGTSVAIFGDLIVGGAPNTNEGSIVLFDYITSVNTSGYRLDGFTAGSDFGADVGVFGDSVIVGAPFEDVIPALGGHHGAAYVVRWDRSTQSLGTPSLLLAETPGQNHRFGQTVAIGGNFALVGRTFFSQPVSVFERRGTADWGPDPNGDGGANPTRELAVNPPQANNLGTGLAVSGGVALVGAPAHDANGFTGSGAVFPFSMGEIDPATYYDPLSLTAPPAGLQRFLGEPITVAWTGGLPDWDVEINLLQTSPTAGPAGLVDTVLNNDGTYNWILPFDLACGAGHRYQFSMKLEGTANTLALGEEFDVPCPQQFSVVSPPAGSSFVPGDSVTVSWTGGAPLWDATVRLAQRAPGNVFVGVPIVVPNTAGALDWTLSTDLPCGEGFRYQFQVSPAGTFNDPRRNWSAEFDLPCAREPLTFVFPDSSTRLLPRQPVGIQWNGGLPEWNVDLQLVEAGSLTPVEDVALAAPNTGVLDWTIPGRQQVQCDANYQLFIEASPAGGGASVDSAHGPPFRIDCSQQVVLTKVADTIQVGPSGDPVYTRLSTVLMDSGNVLFGAQSADGRWDIYSSPDCTWGDDEACQAGLHSVGVTEATPNGGSIVLTSGAFASESERYAVLGSGLDDTGQSGSGVFLHDGTGLRFVAGGSTPVPNISSASLTSAYAPSLAGTSLAFLGSWRAERKRHCYSPCLFCSNRCYFDISYGRAVLVDEGGALSAVDSVSSTSRVGFGPPQTDGNQSVYLVNRYGLNEHLVRTRDSTGSGGTIAFASYPQRLSSPVIHEGDTVYGRRDYREGSGWLYHRNPSVGSRVIVGSSSGGPGVVQHFTGFGNYSYEDGMLAFVAGYLDSSEAPGEGLFLGDTEPYVHLISEGESLGEDVVDGVNIGNEALAGTSLAFVATLRRADDSRYLAIYVASLDRDGDGVPDDRDNCSMIWNPGQEDSDSSGVGDACQDADRDGVLDTVDNCVFRANPDQADSDGDGHGDACDNCPASQDRNQIDSDGDGLGNVCDPDIDEDSHANEVDNCPLSMNDQSNLDGDGLGDVCDPDIDGDGIANLVDGRIEGNLFVDESQLASVSFSDAALGGTSYGQILDAGGLTLRIEDAGNPLEGVLVDVSQGTGEASLEVCSEVAQDPTYVRLDPGDSAVVTCGSVQVRTVQGNQVEVFIGELAVGLTVPGSATAKVDLQGEGQFEVSNDPESVGDILMLLGEDVLVTAPPTAAAIVTETSNQQFVIEPTAESGESITAEVGGQEVVIEPGAPPTLPVSIDIKPGSGENTVNLGSRGSIPVAILSSSSFDAASVNPSTVTLASAPVKLKGKKGTTQASMEDVNGDGLLDQVIHVTTPDLELNESNTQAVLEGLTFGDIAVRGIDVIRVVP